MLRKITASVLFLLMTVVVATSQPGLRYCLCLEEVFFSNCECDTLVDDDECQNTLREENLDSDSFASKEDRTVESLYCTCEDCSTALSLNMEDHITGVGSVPFESLKAIDLQLPAVIPDTINSLLSLRSSILGIRGSPPFVGLIPSEPLRVRYSVFLV